MNFACTPGLEQLRFRPLGVAILESIGCNSRRLQSSPYQRCLTYDMGLGLHATAGGEQRAAGRVAHVVAHQPSAGGHPSESRSIKPLIPPKTKSQANHKIGRPQRTIPFVANPPNPVCSGNHDLGVRQNLTPPHPSAPRQSPLVAARRGRGASASAGCGRGKSPRS
jgi:hypothetical protein